ncbi:AAA family ATPase [Chromobacterium phragmitis]|uniref:AAA family ATPase n=1 Tax=Chromobacterium amazonense TaxID=1382803 RepID=UPI0021B7718B|nr:AAA family ATPase [Chromobacterium amazonense]MBM2884057.1 AAA family ATPase [Chromobacterium amazonense]
MKITAIIAKNFQGLRHAGLSLSGRIALIAGDNGAGKSSLRDAIAMALSGQPFRVAKKKDYAQLVMEGQKGAEVRVEFDDGRAASLKLPDGKAVYSGGAAIGDTDSLRAALPFALNPASFAAAEPDTRRTALFALTGCGVDERGVEQRLIERGVEQRYIDAVLPLVGAGFPAAEADAKRRATEARGAWKGVAGEVYGDKKAEDWSVDARPVPDAEIEQAKQDAQAVQDEINQCQQQMGELRARSQQQNDRKRQIVQLQEQAALLERIKAKLAADQLDLAKVRDEVEAITVGPAPRVGLVHDLARALNLSLTMAIPFGDMNVEQRQHLVAAGKALDQYAAEHGSLADDGVPASAEDVARLPQLQHSLDMMTRAVANDERDLKITTDAVAQLEALTSGEQPEPVSEADVTGLIERVSLLQITHKNLQAKLAELMEQNRIAADAVRRTQQAAQHHADVQAWSSVADAMAPDGIPAEILADALRPVNDRLFELSQMAGWPRIQISRDMDITADGRVYGLLSESEQWRADCIIALTLSIMSGLRLVLLDRFDVLSVTGRNQLLNLLEGLGDQIDTALVFGTMKGPAASDEIVQAFWVEGGEIATGEPMAQAA